MDWHEAVNMWSMVWGSNKIPTTINYNEEAKTMNAKTYCPLGKIDCGKYGGKTYGGDIVCNTMPSSGSSTIYNVMGQNFETCPIPSKQQKIERYNMCEDQPAQIKCHRIYCIWHDGNGYCKNISPAITLNNPIYYTCHSFKEKP